MSTVVENEKIFDYYNLLFPELRMMVIDEMDSADRCRFTRCSKSCNKEAKASRNYIYSLQIAASSRQGGICIYVAHKKFDDSYRSDYNIEFMNKFDKKFMRCCIVNKELWIEELDSSTDLVQHAAEKFKNLLQVYQNNIKRLSFGGSVLRNHDFEIGNLRKLEELYFHASRDVVSYLSKLRRPLKNIYLFPENRMSTLEENEQIYQVQKCVGMGSIKFTYEQMLRLSAPEVFMHGGDLTVKDIVNFIQSWQNGTLGKEIIEYEWDSLDYSNFDVNKLFELLGKVFYENAKWRKYSLKIQHNKEYGKSAWLLWFKRSLIFRLEDDKNGSWSTRNIQELDDNYSYFLKAVSN